MKLLPLLAGLAAAAAASRIDRERLVRASNPHRSASSDDTPLQVGNGNFAFGADVTGLQTFRPFATMSTWGWHSFALPDEEGQRSPEGTFVGLPDDLHTYTCSVLGEAETLCRRYKDLLRL